MHALDFTGFISIAQDSDDDGDGILDKDEDANKNGVSDLMDDDDNDGIKNFEG